jgi:hypothetical protein
MFYRLSCDSFNVQFVTEVSGCVEKHIIEGLEFVGIGIVLQDESFRMNPCPNSKKDSHTVRQAHCP